MENNNEQIDLKDIKLYKSKKLINTLKKLTDEQIDILVDSSVIEFISSLGNNSINSIFRNSSVTMQNKLWTNDKIQRILILGTLNLNKSVCTEHTIRNLQNLNKVTKSQSIKEQLYNNKYFIYVVINSSKIENRFFNIYDLRKTFDGIMKSDEFNLLPSDKQLKIVERLNAYTKDILLPNDFRKRFSNIERILYDRDRTKIDKNIIEQLNFEELLFLDYINYSTENNGGSLRIMYAMGPTRCC